MSTLVSEYTWQRLGRSTYQSFGKDAALQQTRIDVHTNAARRN